METYQEKCSKQEAEIHDLRSQVDFLEKTRNGAGATQEEVAENLLLVQSAFLREALGIDT